MSAKWIDRKALKEGMILHVRSVSILGSLIRSSQDKWLDYIYDVRGMAGNSSWGNHDGIILRHPATREWGVGEALARGSVFTPLVAYDDRLTHDECMVRLYQPIDASEGDMRKAALAWWKEVRGRKYDYLAYGRLVIKCWLMNFSYSSVGWLRKIGNHAAGARHRFWCTEGVSEAYRLAGRDIYSDTSPIPMHTEMVAGELPMLRDRPVTLRQVASF